MYTETISEVERQIKSMKDVLDGVHQSLEEQSVKLQIVLERGFGEKSNVLNQELQSIKALLLKRYVFLVLLKSMHY